jgi:hypothetical protein
VLRQLLQCSATQTCESLSCALLAVSEAAGAAELAAWAAELERCAVAAAAAFARHSFVAQVMIYT